VLDGALLHDASSNGPNMSIIMFNLIDIFNVNRLPSDSLR
jgi:hypothetical protein